jgi:hypothetical protein
MPSTPSVDDLVRDLGSLIADRHALHVPNEEAKIAVAKAVHDAGVAVTRTIFATTTVPLRPGCDEPGARVSPPPRLARSKELPCSPAPSGHSPVLQQQRTMPSPLEAVPGVQASRQILDIAATTALARIHSRSMRSGIDTEDLGKRRPRCLTTRGSEVESGVLPGALRAPGLSQFAREPPSRPPPRYRSSCSNSSSGPKPLFRPTRMVIDRARHAMPSAQSPTTAGASPTRASRSPTDARSAPPRPWDNVIDPPSRTFMGCRRNQQASCRGKPRLPEGLEGAGCRLLARLDAVSRG